MHLVALGDVMVDVVCDRLPPAGERLHGKTSLRAGGSAVNAAIVAADLGASARVVGRIGSDAAGDLIVRALEEHGIVACLARDEEQPTGVTVSLDDAVVADRGANARLSPDDVPKPLRADALLVSGFALFQSGSSEAARAALDRFDGAWAGVDLSSPKLAAAADLELPANVLFATADEAKAVTGLEVEAAGRQLAELFTVVCVKLGADGAFALRGGEFARAGVSLVARTSPFGAGDAFAAAFLLALVDGAALGPAVERACAAGARAAGSG